MNDESSIYLPAGKHSLRLVLDAFAALPEHTELLSNYPNPCNPETWIPYKLADDADVEIRIYTSSGQLIRTLSLGHRLSGFYTGKSEAAYWDGRNEAGENVASGIYFYSLRTSGAYQTKKLVIIR